MLKIINHYKVPTKEADNLRKALEQKGVLVYVELDDGHKHIDLAILAANKLKLPLKVFGKAFAVQYQTFLEEFGVVPKSATINILTKITSFVTSAITAIIGGRNVAPVQVAAPQLARHH